MDDDGRKPPFFEDSLNKPQEHVNIPKQTPEEMKAAAEKFRLRMKWEGEQKAPVSPDRTQAEQKAKVEQDEKTPKATKRVYTFNPGSSPGPTIAGPGRTPAKANGGVADTAQIKAQAEAIKAGMASPKPEATPEPARPGAPIVSRRTPEGTWVDFHEARAFPLTSRPADLQALEKDMTPEARRRNEDAGKYERPADRLHSRWER